MLLNEILPVISPVGYKGGKRSFISSFIKDHRNNRLDFSELFFEKDFHKNLIQKDDITSIALEMVRLSPSSLNSQPWRIVANEEDFHIYNTGKTKMNRIDIGIALCHLDLFLQEKGIDGEFKLENPNLNTKYKYVISWIKKA